MATQKTNITATSKVILTNDGGQASDSTLVRYLSAGTDLTNGNESSQANVHYDVTVSSLGAISTNTYDLTDSTLENPFGVACVFSSVKVLFVKNTSTSAADLLVGGGTDGAGTEAWDTWITSVADNGSEVVRVPQGGMLFIEAPLAGWAVTAGTIDVLGITNESGVNAASYELQIIGEFTPPA